MILNYFFIGFVFSFLIDYFSFKLQNHPAWKNVPEWGWGARIIFVLIWPIGILIFIYTFTKQFFKQFFK
jgi:hypothetical protein